MSEQLGSGASGREAAAGTNSPAGEPLASSSSFVGSARRLSAIRDALGEGALRLAYHAAVPVVVNADLLNLLRVNFFLDDPPDVLPFEVEAELLLSPLFREIGEGLYEIDPGLRNLLLSGLHTRYGEQRVRRVAALLKQYTDAAAAWRSLPELELAQRLTARSFLDPAGAERWLDEHDASAARTSSSSADDGPGREWYIAMRRRVAENSAITTIDTEIRYAGEALLQLLSYGNISARLSVIRGLESLASLPDTDADEVVTVLCAFIQKWDERSPGTSKRVTLDVQAALSLIGSLPHIEFRLEGVALTGANLAGLDFSYAIFDRVMLTELDARALDLTYAQFSDVILSDANLDGAFLDEAFLEFHTLRQVSLNGVSCDGAYIAADTIQGVTGSRADGIPLEIRSLSAEDETMGFPAELSLKEEPAAEAPEDELPESGSPDESSSAESGASLDVEAMLIEARTAEETGQWERTRDAYRGLLDATLVTIHGFWSSPAIWDRLNEVWRADEELRGLRIDPFGYPSPKKPRLPLAATRIPDYDDIAQTLATEYAAVLGRVPDIAIVTHSEGGLILQRFLAWMVGEGRARELSRIRSVVMLACPNNGSEYLESLRRTLGYGRNPQAGSLHVLDRQVADTQRTVLQCIVNAVAVDDYQCRIPFHVYAGSSDEIVKAASVQAAFPGASTIAGNHFTILNPAAPGNHTAEMVKHHVLADIAAARAQPDAGPAPEATGQPEHPAAGSRAGTGEHAVNPRPAPVKDSGPVVEKEVESATIPESAAEIQVDRPTIQRTDTLRQEAASSTISAASPGSLSAGKVRDAMSHLVLTIGPADTIRQAARMMSARRIGAAVVVDPELADIGILTERDILDSVAAGEDPDAELVAQHRTEHLIFAQPDWTLEEAAAAMIRGGFRHLVVVEGQDVAGIISMRDIVRTWTSSFGKVRDGMSHLVLTIGPAHTLRQAARMMSARRIEAAVLIDPEHAGVGILTERDILDSVAAGEDPDAELAAQHRTEHLVYASPEWTLEEAAAAMIRGGFRHLVVAEGQDVAGIISMRDIVRTWTSTSAQVETRAT